MSSLIEFLAAILLWLSAMALCQFGVVVEHQAKAPSKVERTVARSPRQQAAQGALACPHRQPAAVRA
ncbi:hypothetical protein BH10PSE4_BH10PSE4_40220 [soil metagenome]